MSFFRKSVFQYLLSRGLTLTQSGIVVLAGSAVSTSEGIDLIHASATGVIDGVNKQFTSPQPFDCVYINGLMQLVSVHYTKTGTTTFELSDAPLSGDIVSVTYIQ